MELAVPINPDSNNSIREIAKLWKLFVLMIS